MNLILLARGYPLANIPGDTDSRRAYYDAFEHRGLGQADLSSLHRPASAGHGQTPVALRCANRRYGLTKCLINNREVCIAAA